MVPFEISQSATLIYRRFLKDECGIALAAAAIGDGFVIKGSQGQKIWNKAQIKPKTPHQPLALTAIEQATIIRLINEGHTSGSHVTQRHVRSFVHVQFEKRPADRWVDCFLHRRAGAVCKTTLRPQENPGLQVSRQFLDDYIKLIKEYIPLVPTE
jgi:hypothetical protein